MRWMRKEEVTAGLYMGAAEHVPFQPGFGAAGSCGPQVGCEGEAAPAAATGERSGTQHAVRFVGDDRYAAGVDTISFH